VCDYVNVITTRKGNERKILPPSPPDEKEALGSFFILFFNKENTDACIYFEVV
jgi:hypothetical protein